MVKVSDDLKTARARLASPRVWAQGANATKKNQLCAYLATRDLRNMHAADQLLARATGVEGDEIKRPAFWLMDWNDAPGRTLDEVLAVYDKAIAIAEKEEADEART